MTKSITIITMTSIPFRYRLGDHRDPTCAGLLYYIIIPQSSPHRIDTFYNSVALDRPIRLRHFADWIGLHCEILIVRTGSSVLVLVQVLLSVSFLPQLKGIPTIALLCSSAWLAQCAQCCGRSSPSTSSPVDIYCTVHA